MPQYGNDKMVYENFTTGYNILCRNLDLDPDSKLVDFSD